MKASVLAVLLAVSLASPETQNSQVALKDSLANFETFMDGVWIGMQRNPSIPSECVVESSRLKLPIENIGAYFNQMIANSDPSITFDIMQAFNTMMEHLVSVIESCSLRALSYKISSMFTRQGFGRGLYNFAANFNKTIVYWDYFIEDINFGQYQSAGISFGELMGIVLDFWF